MAPSSMWLGHETFNLEKGVRASLELPAQLEILDAHFDSPCSVHLGEESLTGQHRTFLIDKFFSFSKLFERLTSCCSTMVVQGPFKPKVAGSSPASSISCKQVCNNSFAVILRSTMAVQGSLKPEVAGSNPAGGT